MGKYKVILKVLRSGGRGGDGGDDLRPRVMADGWRG